MGQQEYYKHPWMKRITSFSYKVPPQAYPRASLEHILKHILKYYLKYPYTIKYPSSMSS